MAMECRRCDAPLGIDAGFRGTLCHPCRKLFLSEAAKRGGQRRRAFAKERNEWIRELRAEGMTVSGIAAKAECSRRTVFYALQESA